MRCIGVADASCVPDTGSFPVPGNDDALRAVTLFCSVMAGAGSEGRAQAGKFMPGEMAGAAAAATTKPVEAEAEAAAGADDAADAEDEDDEDFEDEEE